MPTDIFDEVAPAKGDIFDELTEPKSSFSILPPREIFRNLVTEPSADIGRALGTVARAPFNLPLRAIGQPDVLKEGEPLLTADQFVNIISKGAPGIPVNKWPSSPEEIKSILEPIIGPIEKGRLEGLAGLSASAKKAIEGALTPEVVGGILASRGGAIAERAVPAIFTEQMAASLPEASTRAWSIITSKNTGTKEKAEALGDLILHGLFTGLSAKAMTLPETAAPKIGAKPEVEPTRELPMREALSALEESGAGASDQAVALRKQLKSIVADELAGSEPVRGARGEIPIIGETKVPLKTVDQIRAELRGEAGPSQIIVPTGRTGAQIERPGAGPPTGGAISFAAPAAAEAIPSARQAATRSAAELTDYETRILQEFINEEASQGRTYPKQALPPGVSYRPPSPAPTQEEFAKRKAREAVEEGLTTPSGYYLDEPTGKTLPEPEPAKPPPQGGVIVPMSGVSKVITKQAPLTELQRGRLRLALSRGAAEDVIRNILRISDKKSAQPQKRRPRIEIVREDLSNAFAESLKQSTEEPNAETIRSDTGQVREGGQIVETGQDISGQNLQQPAPGPPESVGTREETTPPEIPKEVAPATVQVEGLARIADINAQPIKTGRELAAMTEQQWQDQRHVLRSLAFSTTDPGVKKWVDSQLGQFARTHEEQVRLASEMVQPKTAELMTPEEKGEGEGAGPGSPSTREMEAKVKLPVEINAEKLRDQFNLFEQEIGDALTSGGQFLPKELRPDVAKGAPAEKGTSTSKQINQYFVSKLATLVNELKRLRLQAGREADLDTARYFRLIEDRAQQAFRQVQELRRASHEALYFWNQIRAEFQDLARAVGQAPEIKRYKPVFDQLWKDAREGDWVAFGRHLAEYPRVNWFTLGSWTLDFGTNLLATASRLPTWAIMDLGSLVKGDPSVRISSVLRALQLSARNIIPGMDKFRLPPEIEQRLGTTAGGEMAGYGKEVLVDFSEILKNHPELAGKLKEIDRVLAVNVRMKRAVDNTFGRLGAATELRIAAFEEAKRLGLTGDERETFMQNFMQNPDSISAERAAKVGNELKFNQELYTWAEQFSNSLGIKLFVEAYPRWTLQFTRWASEMLGVNPSLWKKMVKGEAKGGEVLDYFVKAATGWGGLYAFNQLFYNRVDPNTMEYIKEDGNRVRLTGRTPMPELYFLNALLRRDWANAKKALAYTSLPLGQLLGGEPGGVLSPFVQTMRESINGRYTGEQVATEFSKMANDLIPGKSVLGFIRALYDPTVREGVGAPVPGVAQALPQRVNPTTGEPLAPKQRLPSINLEIPTVAGTPFPGATRVLNPVEKALLDHGIGLMRPRRTSLIELPAEDVPKEYRREYEQMAGKQVNRIIGEGIKQPGFGQLPVEVRQKVLEKWLEAARTIARAELAEKHGFSAKPVKSIPLKLERLPKHLKGDYEYKP